MKMEDLVEKFLLKDSESNINLITCTNLDFTSSTIALEKTPNK